MGIKINFEPTTPEDKLLVDAVSKLAGSPQDVFTTYTAPTGEVKDKFILNSKGITDLQRYILMGMQFPSDNDKFETKMPASSFSIITKIDDTIWKRTRDQFVEISVSCKKFHDEKLFRIANSASTTRNYASRALHHLSQSKYVNLRENLLILLDPKYRRTKDDDYEDARDTAAATLNKLKLDAAESRADIVEVINSLKAFRSETELLRDKVIKLAEAYDQKRTMPDSTHKTISEAVDAEHDRVLKDLENAESAAEKEEEYKVGIDIGSYLLLTIGDAPLSITGGILSAFSKYKLEDTVIAARNRVKNLDKQKAASAKLITYIAALKAQFKTIDDTMGRAIKAMEDLGTLFDDQQASFEELGRAMAAVRSDMEESVYKARRGGIIDGVDIAINNLGKLKTSADEFYRFYGGEKVEYEKFKIWE
ncbi:hypothetical protein TWF696_007927 [Orbilia brochopaga]|uniref:Uncharacterized protein n=1 Tax=Orbilia brochopaga TaxID=3140254 RepID=A0AAV9USS5_9PEZI